MDVVPNLIPFIAENLVGFLFEIAFDQITEEPMKFYAGVIRTGETATSQTAGRHLKIPAVLLHHHIRSDFGSPENGMHGVIDGKSLFDAVEVSRIGVVPSSLLFNQRQPVRTVPVDLVSRHVHEWRFRAGAAGRF